MAQTVGVTRSAISSKAIEASTEQLQQVQERRWENEGNKHILGIEPVTTENASSVKRLLVHLRDHGLPTDRKYLFVIDGAKALRAGIEGVFAAYNCDNAVSVVAGVTG